MSISQQELILSSFRTERHLINIPTHPSHYQGHIRKCYFCDLPDSLFHIYFLCPVAQTIYGITIAFIKAFFKNSFRLTMRAIILGPRKADTQSCSPLATKYEHLLISSFITCAVATIAHIYYKRSYVISTRFLINFLS